MLEGCCETRALHMTWLLHMTHSTYGYLHKFCIKPVKNSSLKEGQIPESPPWAEELLEINAFLERDIHFFGGAGMAMVGP